MNNFYLLICKDKFFLYRDTNAGREIVYIDGNPFFEYDPRKIRESIRRLIEKIVDENNLSNENELKFVVIENIDPVRNESVEEEIGNLIIKKIFIGNIINETVLSLAKNPKLYIEELGVNFDGECYFLQGGELWRYEYSLLALSIEPSEIMKFVN